jgi:ubiquitin carboxyl-terminal hydrolase 4/11/15
VFTLKRFQGSRVTTSKKITDFVTFPFEGLDLSGNVVGDRNGAGELLYDLFAVSNHIGGIGGGHYTAYGFNAVAGAWYLFDDSRVSLADEKDIVVCVMRC